MFSRVKERNVDILDVSPGKSSDAAGCEVECDPKSQEETSPSASVARITHSLQRMPIVSPYGHHNSSMTAPTPSPMRPYKPRSLSFHSSPMKTPLANPRGVLKFTPTPSSPGHSHSLSSPHMTAPAFNLESPAPSRMHASHLLATPSSPKHQPSVPLVSSTPVTIHTAAASTAVHRLSISAASSAAQPLANNKPGLSKRRVESNGSIRGKNISNALTDITSSSVVSSVTTTTRTSITRDGKVNFSTTSTSTIAEENDKENMYTNFNVTSQDKEEISISKGDSKDDFVFVSAEHYSALHVEGFQIVASADAVELDEASEPLERDSNRMKKKHRTGLVRSQSLSIGMVEPGESISSALARTQSNPSPLRRTLSQTFENFEDQLNEMYQNSLPVSSVSESSIARICPSTMAALLNGDYRDMVDRFVIADCRFSYEFHGGHIPGAFHVDSKQKVERFYASLLNHPGKVAVIFHCEFSRNRGPKSAQYFRQLDRERNQYPRLSFPDVYILNGGYKDFVARYPLHCDPPASYVSMWDTNYNEECKQSLNACRKSWGRSIGLSECDMNRERSLARSQTLSGSGCEPVDSDDFDSGLSSSFTHFQSENLVSASPQADRSPAVDSFDLSLSGTARSSISTQSSDSSMTALSAASSSPPSPLAVPWPFVRAAVHDPSSDELPPLHPATVPPFPSLRESLRHFPSPSVRSLTLRSPSSSFLAAPSQGSRVESFSLLSSTGSPSPLPSARLPLPDMSRHRRRAFSVSVHPRSSQDDDEDS